MFNCPNCGQSLPDDSLFCEACGSRVSTFADQAPSTVEAVKPAKKGKSLKIFLAGMLAVIVIFCTVILPRTNLLDDFNPLNALPFFNKSGDTSTADNNASNSNASDNSGSSANANAAGNSTSSNVTSVVGTWTDEDGNQMIFNEDGSLLCVQPGNNGAYTMYLGGTYEQKRETVEFTLGVSMNITYRYDRLFDTTSLENATATLTNGKLQIPLKLGETATLTQTSTTATGYPPLTSMFGKVIEDSNKNKYKIDSDGKWKRETATGYWICYTGKKAGQDYGQGTLALCGSDGKEFYYYEIPTS